MERQGTKIKSEGERRTEGGEAERERVRERKRESYTDRKKNR